MRSVVAESGRATGLYRAGGGRRGEAAGPGEGPGGFALPAESSPGKGEPSEATENPVLATAMLPIRVALWGAATALAYPLMLLVAVSSAVHKRLTKGTAADILSTSLKGEFKKGPTYSCQFVFRKPFTDEARLRDEWGGIAEEVGADRATFGLNFSAEVPRSFPGSSCVEVYHHVEAGTSLLKKSSTLSNWHAYVEVFNGLKEGDPTVMRCYLPGHNFDGTSCFNLVKELIARYYGERNQIVVHTRLSELADAVLRRQSFFGYLARLPHNVLLNTSDFVWRLLASAPRWAGGPGVSFEQTLLNLDQTESAQLSQALKSRGIKPFAGLIYVAFHAYKKVHGVKPFSIVQQASMQGRQYRPAEGSGLSLAEFRKARRYVGDWLIGCQHYFRDKDFTLEDAQRVYDKLLSDLENMEGSAVSAAMAKAYCPLGGAAVFQFFPFYGEKARVMDSVFFNNYGTRTVHPDAALETFNWGAPFRLGFNCMHINGRTCICLASCSMSLPKLREARDHAYKTLMELIEGEADGGIPDLQEPLDKQKAA